MLIEPVEPTLQRISTTKLGLERVVDAVVDSYVPATLPQRQYMPLSKVWLREDIEGVCDLHTIDMNEGITVGEGDIQSPKVLTQDAEFEQFLEEEWLNIV